MINRLADDTPVSPASSDKPVSAISAAEERSLNTTEEIQNLANFICDMEVHHPDLLRATLPSSALRCFGKALQKNFRGDLHHVSFPTQTIQCFWSHSWHGSAWMKILFLLVYYNGRAALVAGSLSAFLGLTLFFFRLLPGTRREFSLEGATYDFGPWGLGFGCLASGLVLLLWKPSGSVFLDRICIHQTDEELKAAGILSIGGFLKHSESMLVLFDPTYTTRLWTIFELAAFLKAHGDVAHALIIRPTFLATAAVGVFVFLALIAICIMIASYAEMRQTLLVLVFVEYLIFACGGHWLRGYFQQVDECFERLQNFSLKEANSHCCTVDHVDIFGNPMPCDRKVITECIRSWFGSEEQFEAEVKCRVSSAFVTGLGYYAVPFTWFMGASLPILWAYLDLMVARLREGEWFYTLVSFLYTLIIWLGNGPFGYFICLMCAYTLRKRRAIWCLDCAVTLLGTGFMVVLSLAMHAIGPVLRAHAGDLPGMILWGILVASFALFWRWLWLRAITKNHTES
ncbi:GPI10 [Symbiodinium natans]|uniref:GPI10 protein n=1 Tax=Symbiodinium natans TaxID=878477 RepID=A0A812PLN6_9DINO|nr:GPI10 [Symbiodinium natans]